ncbi:MAG: hypothetical protein WC366_02390 [Bacilli bacterium]
MQSQSIEAFFFAFLRIVLMLIHQRTIMKTAMNMNDVKYFRYIDDYWKNDKDDSPLFCVYKVLSIDNRKNEVVVMSLFEYDPVEENFPFSLFEKGDATILSTIAIDDLLRQQEKQRRESCERLNVELEQRRIESEKEKNSHFLSINPRIKRGTEVLLVNYDRRLVDFSKKGDTFYVDDVGLIDNQIAYSVKVIAPRGSRGTYSFYSALGFHENNLKIDADHDDGNKSKK